MSTTTKKRAGKAQSRSHATASRPHGRSRRSVPTPPKSGPNLDSIEALAVKSGVGVSTILRVMGLSRDGFPGTVAVNPRGAALAKEMLEELERVNDDGHSVADDSSLQNCDREGRPFRNVVSEYATKATAVSPQVLEAFYAVLSDYVSTCSQGSTPDASYYAQFCRKQRPRRNAATEEAAS